MKLIVLLGFVALSVAAPQQRGLIGNALQDQVTNAQSQLSSLQDQVSSLTHKIETDAANVISAAEAKIGPLFSEVESDIELLIKKGGVVADCAVKNRNELDEFKTILGNDLPHCVAGLAETIADLLGDISGDITSLGSAIANLGLIVSQCTSGGDAGAGICAATQVGPIVNNILAIVGNAVGAIGIASGKVPPLISNIEYCAKGVVGNAVTTIEKFGAAVKQCA
ncbi:uncharacterized protein LOC119652781 isoform X3 [Hermetia illucens]|uniref:uncharacterized protein LOC119652781 isoform X3 n=1 Tax=Hermetia illucens TaxID=343691 RepID=UPI0018CC3A24|nr:uncharacterized protein LOC119652781 isoform X3 [Hermetia illucens]